MNKIEVQIELKEEPKAEPGQIYSITEGLDFAMLTKIKKNLFALISLIDGECYFTGKTAEKTVKNFGVKLADRNPKITINFKP